MSGIIAKIKSRGYWRVAIHPSRFDAHHISDYSRLFADVRDSSVDFRGWDFPHIDQNNPPHRDRDWVGQEIDWNHYVELWRLYQSGQFVFLGGHEQDWRDQSSLWPPRKAWRPRSDMGVVETLYAITEFIEFAARLATTEAGAPRMDVSLNFVGLRGRRLFSDEPNTDAYIWADAATLETWSWQRTAARAELIAQPREFAAQACLDLFSRFGWDVSVEFLKQSQEGLYRTSR